MTIKKGKPKNKGELKNQVNQFHKTININSNIDIIYT